MRRVTCLLLPTFALLALSVVAARADDEHVSKVVPLSPGGAVRLTNFSGHVTITASEKSEVSVDAYRRGSRDRLDHIKLDIRAEGSTVIIEANHRDSSWHSWLDHSDVVETDMDVKVPRRTNLDVHVFSSPLTISGVEGSYKLRSFSGSIRLDDASGPIEAHSFSGSVEIRAKTWVDDQRIDVDTFSGGIELHLPDSARGTLDFRSFSGRLTSDLPMLLNSSNRRSLSARIGSEGGGSMRLKTFSGPVRIER